MGLGMNLITNDDQEEHYKFTWWGKKASIREADEPCNKELVEAREQSVNFDITQNLFIEGDNLDALKLLQSEYEGKVKMIYIDPPYNTGKDFIYKDNFKCTAKNWIKRTGANPNCPQEMEGRFHSDWLSFIYPRLKIARNFLADDGVIFISIDDNEQANLKKLCDEIFGSDNFVSVFPWRKRTAKSDVPFSVSQDFEWVVVYAKSDIFTAGEEFDRKYYSSIDYPNDKWRLADLTTQKVEQDRPNSAFDLINPKNGKVYPYNPNRLWGITKDTFIEYYNKGKIVFPDDYDFINISKPAYRVFESEDKVKSLEKYGSDSPMKAISTFLPKEVGMSESGNKEIIELFGKKMFSYPKSVSLIKYFTAILNDKDSIILDFFAGSSTTAHAVMQLNAEDGGNRKFIMVQIPEVCDPKSEAAKAGYATIAEISKERIRRAGKKINKGDVGFKVLRVT